MAEREFVDYSSVRDLLLDAIERRGEISYEQTMALQHAEWRASAGGHPAGIKVDPAVFSGLMKELSENEKLAQHLFVGLHQNTLSVLLNVLAHFP